MIYLAVMLFIVAIACAVQVGVEFSRFNGWQAIGWFTCALAFSSFAAAAIVQP